MMPLYSGKLLSSVLGLALVVEDMSVDSSCPARQLIRSRDGVERLSVSVQQNRIYRRIPRKFEFHNMEVWGTFMVGRG